MRQAERTLLGHVEALDVMLNDQGKTQLTGDARKRVEARRDEARAALKAEAQQIDLTSSSQSARIES